MAITVREAFSDVTPGFYCVLFALVLSHDEFAKALFFKSNRATRFRLDGELVHHMSFRATHGPKFTCNGHLT